MAMFDLGQKVVVITDNEIAYDAVIVGRAKGDNGGPGAYRVTLNDLGSESSGQWHKAADVFLPEPTEQEKKASWEEFLKE